VSKPGYTVTEAKLLAEALAKARAAEKSNGRLLEEIGVQFGSETGATGRAKTSHFGARRHQAAQRLLAHGDLVYVTQVAERARGLHATTIYYRLSDAAKARLACAAVTEAR
jgi:hypothetical protein